MVNARLHLEKITLIDLVVCALCTSAFALPFEGLWKLDVIHYNDFHSRFEETSVERPVCTTNNSLCLGGFPRLYATVNSLLREKPRALLLDAGDSFQGTLWYTLLKWNVTQQFMNLLPHDAHAIGNHEFDDGPAGLAPYLRHLRAPCLAANMDTSQEPSLRGICQNSTIVTRGGRKIGIIGVITVSTALLASPGNTIFTDERLAAQREAAKLAAQGVDIIILLSHAGLDVDRDIAANYSEHIDLIVGGHTHSLLWNGPAPSQEPVSDVYPIIVHPSENRDHKVLIVQASAFTKYMGNLTVYFDFRGHYHSWEGGPIFLNRSYHEDEEIKAMLKPYAEQVHEVSARVVGRTQVDLERKQCLCRECLLGNLIGDALLQYSQGNYPSDLPTVAILTQGSVYTDFHTGPITYGALFEALPYRDRILLFRIKGKHLLEAFEQSVSGTTSETTHKAEHAFQIAGLRVRLNVSMPVYKKVVSAQVQEGADYRELEAERYIRVVAADFLVRSSGFLMFEKRLDTQVIGRDLDILEKYILEHDPLHPNINQRLIIET